MVVWVGGLKETLGGGTVRHFKALMLWAPKWRRLKVRANGSPWGDERNCSRHSCKEKVRASLYVFYDWMCWYLIESKVLLIDSFCCQCRLCTGLVFVILVACVWACWAISILLIYQSHKPLLLQPQNSRLVVKHQTNVPHGSTLKCSTPHQPNMLTILY